jgi:mediator of RNA polymerase II transcription subunit 31
LAQRDYFKDPAFVNYLKYLLYWKQPEYAKFLKVTSEFLSRLLASNTNFSKQYPMCLYFLDLLQSEEFRRKIVTAPCVKFIDDQAILLWQHYTRRRTKTLDTQHFLHNPPNPPNAQQNQNGTSQKMS